MPPTFIDNTMNMTKPYHDRIDEDDGWKSERRKFGHWVVKLHPVHYFTAATIAQYMAKRYHRGSMKIINYNATFL